VNSSSLKGAGRQVTTTLCGRKCRARSGVQVQPASISPSWAEREGGWRGCLHDFPPALFRIDDYEITVFRDARSIIRGTQDPAIARGSVCALYRSLKIVFSF